MLFWLETLTINLITSPKTISKLTNLKKLNIIGQTQREYEDNIVINYDEINELRNLNQLVIVNNYHIKCLDLSNLKDLEYLILVTNQNLEVINGLDQLQYLHVVIVGSNIKNKEWLNSYISNTKKTRINILDYHLFNYIAKDKNIKHKLFEMIDEIYVLANKIIKENITDDKSEEEKNQDNKYFMQMLEEFSVTHDILVTTEFKDKQKTKR